MYSKYPLGTLILGLSCASAFTGSPSVTLHLMLTSRLPTIRRPSPNTLLHAYIPDGLSEVEYRKIKEKEEKTVKGKNLGSLGPRGFKSRSMRAFQEAHEKGLTSHVFAPVGYKDKLQRGEIRKVDVPYMVRGGSWDHSDVRGAKKQRWLKTDKDYANGGYKKEQSASLLGSGPGLDWAGKRSRDVNLGNRRVPGFS